MLKQLLTLGLAAAVFVVPSRAQNSEFAVSVPVTLSGGALYSERLQFADPTNPAGTGAFRAMFYPTVQLGPNWFGYAAVQVRSIPYFYYDAYDPSHEVYTDALQAYIGYSFRKDRVSMVFKAGKLTSAFGSFPLHYDDAENPLLDQPLSYITDIPLRPDQLLCGTKDLLNQHYGSVSESCGGTPGRMGGPAPVTLYGLPGVQAEISSGRVDARLQLTSGSPMNPQGFTAGSQYLNWTAGGGYTIHQGLRIGVSGFRGPYLDPVVASLLPSGTTVRNFPASGIGADMQWARGRFSVNSELHRFRFDQPNFVDSPTVTSGYVEMKTVITPRLYVAGRGAFLYAGHVTDHAGVSTDQFAPYIRSYELAAGVWITHNQLLKGGYEWLRNEGQIGHRTDVFGVEYVVQIHSLAWAFR